jgi:hypothetical protein
MGWDRPFSFQPLKVALQCNPSGGVKLESVFDVGHRPPSDVDGLPVESSGWPVVDPRKRVCLGPQIVVQSVRRETGQRKATAQNSSRTTNWS